MHLNKETLLSLSEKYGDSFYVLDDEKLKANYSELLAAFRSRYPNTFIAYSYKTNYIPHVCRTIERLGGWAEVVSDMEYELAGRIGADPHKIILNGPYKDYGTARELLMSGGLLNIDSESEIEMLERICASKPGKRLRVGIRCNFDIGDGCPSRFGIDTDSGEFARVLAYVLSSPYLRLSGLHCHFAARDIGAWRNKVSEMLGLIDKLDTGGLELVDLGGGLFGHMEEMLKAQFPQSIPDFADYAEAAAAPFAEYFAGQKKPPKLLIEPGTALTGDAMRFVCRVAGIKTVHSRQIATLTGSVYNIDPARSGKMLPVSVCRVSDEGTFLYDADFAGYTCIESDYLYRGYTGPLDIGDFIVFSNAGSYSVVLKPPFIRPNRPVVCQDNIGKMREAKRGETFDDVFQTYSFE